jgi:hypothetical protein
MPEILAQKLLDLDLHLVIDLLKRIQMEDLDAFNKIKELIE